MLPKRHRLPLRTELAQAKKRGKLVQGRLFSLLAYRWDDTSEVKPREPQPRQAGRGEHLRGEAQLQPREHLGGETKRPSRFGFIISSKIHKRATKRNQARRLLTEAIRPMLAKVKPGFAVVFLAKKALIGKELNKVAREVEKLFRKAKLL